MSGDASAASARDGGSGSGVSQGQLLDAEKALSVALGHKAGSYVVEIDEENGRDWEVTLVTKDKEAFEVVIDGVSGDVVSERSASANSWEREAPAVTAAEAIATALAEKPGRLDSLDLDRENGKVVWEVKIETGSGEWELWVNPVSGEILKTEYDD